MESEVVNEASPRPKLALFSLPSQPKEPPGMLTPPLLTSVSVPFQWEEAPGKPRHYGGEGAETKAKCARSLELPPRLLVGEAKVTNIPSPTTVLDGPEMLGRTLSFSYALRSPSIKGSGGFGSMRWAGFKKNKEAGEGHFDFSPTVSGGDGGGTGGGDHTKVKITRVRRKASFFHSGGHHTRSHIFANFYESLKQVVPWRRRKDKLRKTAPVGYEPEKCNPIPTC